MLLFLINLFIIGYELNNVIEFFNLIFFFILIANRLLHNIYLHLFDEFTLFFDLLTRWNALTLLFPIPHILWIYKQTLTWNHLQLRIRIFMLFHQLQIVTYNIFSFITRLLHLFKLLLFQLLHQTYLTQLHQTTTTISCKF